MSEKKPDAAELKKIVDEIVSQPCPVCNGSGKVVTGFAGQRMIEGPCPKCGGSGTKATIKVELIK